MQRVYVYTHIHPHLLSTASKNIKDTDNTPISPSVKNLRQATSALHRLDNPPNPCPPTTMNKLCIHARMWTPCRECVTNVCWCQKTPVQRTHLQMHWRPASDTCIMHATPTTNICRYTRTCELRCRNYVVMETIAIYFESSASIVQADGCRTPTCYPGELGPTTARSRK